MATIEAMAAAVEMIRHPGLVHSARSAPLPRGVDVLLQVAAGDEQAIIDVAAATGHRPATLEKASGFFIEQILFDPEADNYRRLGVAHDATSQELRRNMALIARWLHPDLVGARSGSAASGPLSMDNTHFATRLTGAWEALKTPERREAYDQILRASGRHGPRREATTPRDGRLEAWPQTGSEHLPQTSRSASNLTEALSKWPAESSRAEIVRVADVNAGRSDQPFHERRRFRQIVPMAQKRDGVLSRLWNRLTKRKSP